MDTLNISGKSPISNPPYFRVPCTISVIGTMKMRRRQLTNVVDDDDDEDVQPICECLSEYSFLLSCPVKVLEITEYRGTKGELEQMKHFLEKLSCLELVKVLSKTYDEEEEEEEEEERSQQRINLLNLPRSSKCKIQLDFTPRGGSF